MTYNVTSWFNSALLDNSADIVRKFLIYTTDYSERVTRWPRVKNSWNGVKPQSITIELANEDNLFSFIQTDKTNLSKNCYIKLGLTHPQSGDELVTMFTGTMDKVTYSKGSCRITLKDKFKQLTERVVGNEDLPMSLSNQLPSDIAWTAITCYGGFSDVQSVSNADINWTDFEDWAAVFSGDNVLVGVNIKDKKVSEVLKTISRYTMSAIYVENGKLTFKRFSLADSSYNTFNDDTIIDVSLSIDDEDIINRQYVYGSYDVDSDYWGLQVYEESANSITNYGVREQIEKYNSIWYVDSPSAINLAQRIMSISGNPYDRISIESPIAVGLVHIGDTIAFQDTFFNGATDGMYRLMDYDIDLDKALVKVNVDRTQFGSPFTLDISALDGTDVLI